MRRNAELAPADDFPSHVDSERGQPRVVLTEISALRKLVSWRAIALRPPAVELRIPGMSDEVTMHWEAQIGQQLSACGCLEAALFTLTAIGGYVAYCLLMTSEAAFEWGMAATGLVICMLAAAFGKLVGLARARRRLANIVTSLEECLRQAEKVR